MDVKLPTDGIIDFMKSPDISDETFREMRDMALRHPINIVHTGSRLTRDGIVDSYAIDIETCQIQPPQLRNAMVIVKGREPDYATLEEKVLGQITDDALLYGRPEKELHYLRHYGSLGMFGPAPVLNHKQAQELRDKFRESFPEFQRMSELSGRFDMAMGSLRSQKLEHPATVLVRAMAESVIKDLTSPKKVKNTGPQPRKKWRQAWKTPHPTRR